jgi:TolA-binding protein
MASGTDRRVTVTAEPHDHDDDHKEVKLQDQMQQMTAQLDQLRTDLRRINESNRELAEKNKELQARTRSKIISDSVVAPKPFLGKTAEQDPVDWLLWFEKYKAYKKMSDGDTRELFIMLMQGAAADWMNAQLADSVREPSYERLTDCFREHYFKPKELRWRDASQIWREKQLPQEKVLDYIVRLKKLARELDLQPEVLKMIILQGFRPAIQAAVIQKGEIDMDEMIHVAKLAESVEVASSDATTQKLLDMMKTSVEAAQKQATELQTLSSKVATMSTKQDDNQNNGRQERNRDARTSEGRVIRQRQLKPTPQNLQRINYTRQANSQATPMRSFRAPTREAACTKCSLLHSSGSCPAYGQQCRRCGRVGHFARECRSARSSTSTRPTQQ